MEAAARQRVEAAQAAEAEARKQAQVVAEAKAKAAARQQALMETATAAEQQWVEAVEAAEAEVRQQAQVVAEAKAKAAALQQAWLEVATVEARQKGVGGVASLGGGCSSGSPPAGRGGGSRIQATAEQQRIAELTRARAELTAKVIRLGDHDVDIRRLSARIHP